MFLPLVLPCLALPLGAVAAAAAAAAAAPSSAFLAQRAPEEELPHEYGNLCEHQGDGWQCRKGHVVDCRGQRTASAQKCAFYQDCEEQAGRAFCREDACDGEPDGTRCKHDHVVQCRGSVTTNFTACDFYQDCEETSDGTATCREKTCEDKSDGAYCKHGHVVECRGSAAVNAMKCAFHEKCKEDAAGRDRAACQEKTCRGRADGSYCKHDGVIQCRGGAAAGFTKCPFYQECEDDHDDDGHDDSHDDEDDGNTTTTATTTATTMRTTSKKGAAECREDACDGKADGWRCKHDHMVKCAGGRTVDVKMCPLFQECEDKSGAAACM